VISIGPNSIPSSLASITDSSSINLLDSKALYDTRCVSPHREACSCTMRVVCVCRADSVR
jgi:hypothetical protein